MLTGLIDGPLRFTENFLKKLEATLGLVKTGGILSFILLILAALYCLPALELINHGVDYAQLATTPFDLEGGNRFQNRILSPLIGYLLFLRGPLFIFVPLIMALLLIALMYSHLRKSEIDKVSALGICAIIVFSSPVLFTLHFAGYVDTTSYLLLFLCYVFRKSPLPIFVCYSLALLNHESNVFALPWIILLTGYNNESKTSDYLKVAGASILAFLPLFLARYLFIEAETHLHFEFFTSVQNIKDSIWLQKDNLIYGVFQSFKLFWCLPIVAGLMALRRRDFYIAGLLTCIVVCAGLQLFVAADTSR